MNDISNSNLPPTETPPARSVQRVRHVLKARRVTVLRTLRVSPNIVRVTFGGDELHDFVSASFDDHVKLLLPATPGAAVVLPTFQDGRPALADGAPRPIGRDYTPRRFDLEAGELEIEFALHGDGPAASWAAQATAGQQLGIGGPRGSFVIPPDFDWHVLIGDDTALPAIARRLEELPAGVVAFVVIELDDLADQRELTSKAELHIQWVLSDAGSAALLHATGALKLPDGEGYAWAAGEAKVVAAVREVLVTQHGIDKRHIRAAAYWKRGESAHHENLAD